MTIKDRLFEALSVQAGEGPKVFGLILYSLFIGIFCAFFFSAANALFLDTFEITMLPVAYIVAGLVGYVAVMAFSRFERTASFTQLLMVNLLFLLALIGGFWALLLASGESWVIFLMFVWLVPTFSLQALGFWGLAIRLFDLRQGKRLFGLVGAGEEVSTIIGFLLVPVLVELLASPTHLLLISAGGVVACMATVMVLTRTFAEDIAAGQGQVGPSRERVGLGKLVRQRYFVLMAALMVMLTLGHYIVDFSFMGEVRLKFVGADALAKFIGFFFGVVKAFELVMKAFLSGRLLSAFGLQFGLSVLPVVMVLCVAMAAVIGTLGLEATYFFVLVALTKLVWSVIRTSLFEPSFRVLFQPVPGHARLAYQTHVEGTVKQIAIGAVGLSLLFVSRSEAFKALNLYYALLPILAVWIWGVFATHRLYRERLMGALSQGAPSVVRPSGLEMLGRFARQAPAPELERSVEVMTQVAPGQTVPFLVRLLPDVDTGGRVCALRRLASLRAVDARRTIEEYSAGDESPAVRGVANLALVSIQEVEELAAAPDRLAEMAGSSEPEDRALAATALGALSGRDVYHQLNQLLWDRDWSVRRAALLAAGRQGSPDFWHRIIHHLSMPAFRATASAALVTIGEAVVPELEMAFGKAEDDPDLRLRILEIYERIGGDRAGLLLLDKLAFPDETVRRHALGALSQSQYRAGPENAPRVKRAIEQVVRNFVWNTSALVDLGGDPRLAEVRDALDEEVEQNRVVVFLLLALLYDPRSISLVKRNLDSTSRDANVYALEILELLVDPELKPIVFPVIEPLLPTQRLRRLEPYFAHRRLEPRARLEGIALRHQAEIGAWTKACAIEASARLAEGGVSANLVAALFHPDRMLQEVAAWSMRQIDPKSLEEHAEKLNSEARERIDWLLRSSDGIDAAAFEERSVFGRVAYLQGCPGLTTLPRRALEKLASGSELIELPVGKRLPSPREPRGVFYLLVEGRVAVVPNPGGGRQPGMPEVVEPDFGYPFDPEAVPVEVEERARLLRLDGDLLLELMAIHPDLMLAVVRPGAEVTTEVAGAEAVARVVKEGV